MWNLTRRALATTRIWTGRYSRRPSRPARRAGTRGVRGVRTAQHGDCSQQWQARQAELLAACGIDGERSWNDYAARVRQTRRGAGQPLTRWSPAHLLAALDLAVRSRGWPPEQAATALQQVASDPATRSPASLAEAGPWWDRAIWSTPRPLTPSTSVIRRAVELLGAEA